MFVLCGFYILRKYLMPLHLSDNGQGIDTSLAVAGNVRAQIDQLLPVFFSHFCIVMVFHNHTSCQKIGCPNLVFSCRTGGIF